MSISDVKQMWSRQTGSKRSRDGLVYEVTMNSAYQVSHSADATVQEIVNAPGIPELGDLFSEGGVTYQGIHCTSVGPPERIGPVFSIVPVTFEGRTPEDLAASPTKIEPKIVYQSVSSTESIDTDIFHRPITNVNGEVVEGMQDDIWDFTLTVQRPFAAVDTYALRLYARSYNSDTFFGWPPGTASLRSFSAEPVYQSPLVVSYYNVTAQIMFREPYNTIPLHAWWKRYRNEGYYERAGTTVTLSGGGGSGATAYAIASAAGAITGIAVTNRGAGYGSAPTVTIASTTGGTGAAATATVSDGRVTGISVTSGGSGYKSKLIRAVDEDKEPVTRPVLLKANGQRELNADNAVWLERPTKRPMPYNALGLF